jgi:hypothetical protein
MTYIAGEKHGKLKLNLIGDVQMASEQRYFGYTPSLRYLNILKTTYRNDILTSPIVTDTTCGVFLPDTDYDKVLLGAKQIIFDYNDNVIKFKILDSYTRIIYINEYYGLVKDKINMEYCYFLIYSHNTYILYDIDDFPEVKNILNDSYNTECYHSTIFNLITTRINAYNTDIICTCGTCNICKNMSRLTYTPIG